MFVRARVDQSTGVTVDQKVGEIDTWLNSETWPQDLQFHFRGADEDQQESFEFLVKAMVASLFLMFIILLTQFNIILSNNYHSFHRSTFIYGCITWINFNWTKIFNHYDRYWCCCTRWNCRE